MNLTPHRIMTRLNQATLQLFGAVLKKGISTTKIDTKHGLVIEAGASHAKEDIEFFARNSKLNGQELNKSFYKSWEIVKNSTRLELAIDQILHYCSTYGTDFEGEMYLPEGTLDIPDLKLKFKIIKALTKEDLITRGLDVLKSGIALKEETLKELMFVLDNLGYSFTGTEGIRNKEAVILIADKYGIYPVDPVEFLRYLVFKATDTTMLIKDRATLEQIKNSSYNPSAAFNNYSGGLEELASIFNRFKPIFLAFKSKAASTVNKISKLSKTHHKPMVQNELNLVTQSRLTNNGWLENATPFALFKALNACHSRMNGQEAFTYRIRNGRSYTKSRNLNSKRFDICEYNYNKILKFLKNKLPKNQTVFIPDCVTYALPTSEKMFVGNVPTGTRVSGKKLNVGVYWRNEWGARDIDLSSLDLSGYKVGWNSSYSHDSVYYSGDITNAPDGAVEYLRFNRPEGQHLITFNVYSGNSTPDYKVVIGEGNKVSREHMMDPNKVLFETKCTAPQRQTAIGSVHAEDGRSVFTFLNFGTGSLNISGGGELTALRIKSLFQQWDSAISANELIKMLGWDLVGDPSDADIDLSLAVLEKDTFIKIFS